MKACLTRTAEVNMRKTITAIAVAASLLLTGCSYSAGSLFDTGEPYDSEFKDAEEFAEYWCGPCKEVDSYKVNDITVHEMKDDEWGFTYAVYEMWVERGDTGIKDVSYTAEEFSYYYLQTFIEESDLDEYLEENGITLDAGELQISDVTGLSFGYYAKININTDRLLTDDEAAEIMSKIEDALKDFDEREFFTKSVYTSEVFITIWSAPWEKDTEVGAKYHTWNAVYGYTMGVRQSE